jgi:hypothetical protein
MYDYEIRLQGYLDQRWSAWFDGLTISYESDGSTRLRGPFVDEAARQVEAWQSHRNRDQAKVNWRFTTDDARIKLTRLYPSQDV